MSRSFTYTALVLRVKPSGESNREAWFLTAEEGILRATVFGGPKSRLRAHIAPFHQGVLWIYHDPVRDSRKVSDFDVRLWRPGIRERYERAMAAGAVVETVLSSHGGGGVWARALELTGGALDALEEADEKTCGRILIHFLWNWADVLGVRPGLTVCTSCGHSAGPGEALWFSPAEGTFLCPACSAAARGGNVFAIGPGARRWLLAVQDLDASLLSRLTLDEASRTQAKALATAILSEALGKRLSTWDE
ncbi:MAG: DNA repair protein RecO C-terminal domain-containing protein [Treponema sp.]|nr:DNA repair protein RecO C-terminal domain-containing protein [Treponema sp.]